MLMSQSKTEKYDHLFKMLVMGSTSVGKTSIILRYVDDRLYENSMYTMRMDFKNKTLQLNDKKIKLQIWKNLGQKKSANFFLHCPKGVKGILLSYDITSRKSFTDLNNWIIAIQKKAEKEVAIVLVGNKCDLKVKREVDFNEGLIFAQKHGMPFMEVSTKESLNVNKAFEVLVQEMLKTFINKEEELTKDSDFYS